MASAPAARGSVVVEGRAAVLLKRCSRNFMPPARIETPNTSRTLPMIEPVIDAFTTPVSPFESAISAMINSAALPKVAFNNPPIPWPRRSASSSVARPIQPARGTTARQEQTNRAVLFPLCGQIRIMTATGAKTRSQLSEGFSNDFTIVLFIVAYLRKVLVAPGHKMKGEQRPIDASKPSGCFKLNLKSVIATANMPSAKAANISILQKIEATIMNVLLL